MVKNNFNGIKFKQNICSIAVDVIDKSNTLCCI